VDAFPHKNFRGHVKQVSPVISQLDSPLRDVRIYLTQIAIDEPIEGLRPDMSAEATIFEKEARDPVLAVPAQALVHAPEQGHHCTCFVMTPDGPEQRDVVVGLPTEQMVEVQSGLHAGDEIVLNPQTLLKDKPKAHAPEGDEVRLSN
jgi:HlyD family secretion protein